MGVWKKFSGLKIGACRWGKEPVLSCGRVRTPVPAVCPEVLSFFRRSRVRSRLVFRAAQCAAPTKYGPVGAGPRPARGRTLCAPTVETGPGTLVRKRQAQKHNRTNSNFLPAQAPSGAGRDRTQALLILRAGTVLPASRGNPRKMGSGESGPMDLGGAKRSRSPSAASPVAFCLLFRHGKRRSPPAGGEIPCIQRPYFIIFIIAPSSGPSGHLSLSPLSLRDISP